MYPSVFMKAKLPIFPSLYALSVAAGLIFILGLLFFSRSNMGNATTTSSITGTTPPQPSSILIEQQIADIQLHFPWRFVVSKGDGVAKFTLHYDNRGVSYKETMEALANKNDSLISLLSETIVLYATVRKWDAVFWECRPIQPSDFASPSHPFEFVLLNAPSLSSVLADIMSFKEHFDKVQNAGKLAVCFPNIGKDAYLTVPRPGDGSSPEIQYYAHLLAFLSHSSQDQKVALWSLLGSVYISRIAEVNYPIWLSTSGLGVYWLHVRIDKMPKYYNYVPYKQAFKS